MAPQLAGRKRANPALVRCQPFLDDFVHLKFIAQAVGGPPQISLDPLGSEGYVLSLLSICQTGGLRQDIGPLGVE